MAINLTQWWYIILHYCSLVNVAFSNENTGKTQVSQVCHWLYFIQTKKSFQLLQQLILLMTNGYTKRCQTTPDICLNCTALMIESLQVTNGVCAWPFCTLGVPYWTRHQRWWSLISQYLCRTQVAMASTQYDFRYCGATPHHVDTCMPELQSWTWSAIELVANELTQGRSHRPTFSSLCREMSSSILNNL